VISQDLRSSFQKLVLYSYKLGKIRIKFYWFPKPFLDKCTSFFSLCTLKIKRFRLSVTFRCFYLIDFNCAQFFHSKASLGPVFQFNFVLLCKVNPFSAIVFLLLEDALITSSLPVSSKASLACYFVALTNYSKHLKHWVMIHCVNSLHDRE